MKAADTRKLLASEMHYYRRDKVQRNFSVVDIIKQRKLQLFGHVVCLTRDL